MRKRQAKKNSRQIDEAIVKINEGWEVLKGLGIYRVDLSDVIGEEKTGQISLKHFLKLPFVKKDEIKIEKRLGEYKEVSFNYKDIQFFALTTPEEIVKYLPKLVKKEAKYIEIDGVRYTKEV